MTNEIDRLLALLKELPPNDQRELVSKFTEIVEWFSEPEEPMPAATTGDWGSSRSISFSFSRGRSRGSYFPAR